MALIATIGIKLNQKRTMNINEYGELGVIVYDEKSKQIQHTELRNRVRDVMIRLRSDQTPSTKPSSTTRRFLDIATRLAAAEKWENDALTLRAQAGTTNPPASPGVGATKNPRLAAAEKCILNALTLAGTTNPPASPGVGATKKTKKDKFICVECQRVYNSRSGRDKHRKRKHARTAKESDMPGHFPLLF
jgi:hypothetical protein